MDFVLETVGRGNLQRSVKVLKNGGKIVNLSSVLTQKSKATAEYRNIQACFFMTVYSSGRDMKIIADLLAKEIISPHISNIFDFNDLPKAHHALENEHFSGKIITRAN